MRVVGGRWAGRHLTSPGRHVRPTAEAVRAGWMAALGPELEGARVVDLFAGSGALGLEALSRGARSVDFVENGPASLHALKANVAALRARDRSRVFKKDVLEFLSRVNDDAYDLGFADPPYRSTVLEMTINRWLERPFSAVLAVEHPIGRVLPPPAADLTFGEIRVSLYRRPM